MAGAKRVTEELRSTPPVSVVTVPPKLIPPPIPTFVMLSEPTLIGKAPVAILVPEKVTVRGPPFVAVTDPPRMMLLALRVMPVTVLVFRFPLVVTVPPVSVILTEAAVNPLLVILWQLVTTKAPIRVVPPIWLERRMSPVPERRVRANAPLTVPERVMSPAPALEEREVIPPSVMGSAKDRFAFTVRIVPDKVTEPPPL
jgi:hypothetical protein